MVSTGIISASVNVCLLALVVAVIIFYIYESSSSSSQPPTSNGSELTIKKISTINYVGLLLWPIVWDVTIGYELMYHFPFTFLGFLWPMVLIFLDIYFMDIDDDDDNAGGSKSGATTPSSGKDDAPKVDNPLLLIHGNDSHRNIQMDATAVITIAFAMGALLLSNSDPNIAAISSPMIMFALLFTIAFVIPSTDMRMEASSKKSFDAIQRIFLQYAIGFVIAGIAINLSSLTKHHDFVPYKQQQQQHLQGTKAPNGATITSSDINPPDLPIEPSAATAAAMPVDAVPVSDAALAAREVLL